MPTSEPGIHKMADQTFHSQGYLEDEPEFTFFPKLPTKLRDMIAVRATDAPLLVKNLTKQLLRQNDAVTEGVNLTVLPMFIGYLVER